MKKSLSSIGAASIFSCQMQNKVSSNDCANGSVVNNLIRDCCIYGILLVGASKDSLLIF